MMRIRNTEFVNALFPISLTCLLSLYQFNHICLRTHSVMHLHLLYPILQAHILSLTAFTHTTIIAHVHALLYTPPLPSPFPTLTHYPLVIAPSTPTLTPSWWCSCCLQPFITAATTKTHSRSRRIKRCDGMCCGGVYTVQSVSRANFRLALIFWLRFAYLLL